MQRAIVTFLVVASTALAGCQGAPEQEGGNEPGSPSNGMATAQIDVPNWEVGQYWSVAIGNSRVVNIAVSEQSGNAWQLDADNDFEAILESFYDNEIIGAVRTSDFAHEGEDWITPFKFPIIDGQEWQTSGFLGYDSLSLKTAWDGESNPIITAKTDGRVAAEYTYDTTGEWFGYIQMKDYDETDSFRLEFTRQEGNFTGELVRALKETVVESSGVGQHQETNTLSFSDASDADIYASGAINCEQGTGLFAMGPIENIVDSPASVSDDGVNWDPQCPSESRWWEKIGDEPDVGEWGYTIDVASPDAEWSFQAWLVRFERFTL